MNHVRIHGDPFGDRADQSALRSFLRFAVGSGMRCSLSLSGVGASEPGCADERTIPLTDGTRSWAVATRLPPAEVELLMRAAAEPAAATAPVVVFAPEDEVADVAVLVGLEWPEAATVVVARAGGTAADLLARVRAELRWAGIEHPKHGLSEGELRPWLALPEASADGPLVHVAEDAFAAGTDLVVDLFVRRFAGTGRRLRLVLPNASDTAVAAIGAQLGEHASAVEIARSQFQAGHVRDAAAIVLPWRIAASTRDLVLALASGRPVAVSRCDATAAVIDGRGIVFPIGGRQLANDAGHGPHFAPEPRAIECAVVDAVGAGGAAAAQRARVHAVASLVRGRAAAPPPVVGAIGDARPTVVLEAPLFETSSTAELTIATARALVRRGNVDLRLVANGPFRHDLGWLRARAPELVPLLCRNPGRVDLWLSSGWPVRAARPDCRLWALRVDWEFGALPLELTPHVTQSADAVVVHSEHVRGSVIAAGRPADLVTLLPHGVDEAMHPAAPPAADVLAFKGRRPAVLFCGGLVWRKGFDVFLGAVLAARAAGRDFAVVVKGVGSDQHYGGFHLGELLRRIQRTPGAPPVLHVERPMSRAELASLYTACDLMLHPYRGEGFGMPVLEARACGLPVLATAGGGAEAILQGPGAVRLPATRRVVELPGAHVGDPWVLEPDSAGVSSALLAALDGLAGLRTAAGRSTAAVRAAFSWDSAAATIEQLAARGLERRRPAAVAPEPLVEVPSAPARVLSPVREPAAV